MYLGMRAYFAVLVAVVSFAWSSRYWSSQEPAIYEIPNPESSSTKSPPTFVSSEPPSQTKVSSGTNSASNFMESPWPSETLIIINGHTFLKPAVSVSFPQPNGADWILAPDHVVYDLETFALPTSTILQATQLKASGSDHKSNVVQVLPGPPLQKPDVGRLQGVSAVKKAIQDLSSTVNTSVSSDIKHVVECGARYSANHMYDGEFITLIKPSLDPLRIYLRLMSFLVDNIWSTLGNELKEMSSLERQNFDSFANSIRDMPNCNEYYSMLVQELATSTGGDLLNLRGLLKQVFGTGNIFNTYLVGWRSIDQFRSRPLGTVSPSSVNSSVDPNGTTASVSAPSLRPRGVDTGNDTASESNSTGSTEIPQRYFMLTYDGTTAEAYQALIQRIDGAKGRQADNGVWQSYATNLTQSQADNIQKNEANIVQAIGPANSNGRYYDALRTNDSDHLCEDLECGLGNVPCEDPGCELGDEAGVNDLDKRAKLRDPNNPQMVNEIPPTRDYIQFLSQDPKDRLNPAGRNMGSFWHESLGKGSRIYVLDSGFRTSHYEFSTRPGPLRTWCVPNSVTGATATEDMTDYAFYNPRSRNYWGHGTQVAAIAGGATVGVAPNAELVLIKLTNAVWTRQGWQLPPPGFPDVEWTAAGLDHIIEEFKNPELSKPRKTVVNLSLGYDRTVNLKAGEPDIERELFLKFFKWSDQNDVVIVCAAGNAGNSSDNTYGIRKLDDAYPQRMGSQTNSLITVGAVNQDATLYWQTTPKLQGGGDMTVYAVGEDLNVPVNWNDYGWNPRSGTSVAAPAIAGMIAYWLALPDKQTRWSASTNFLMDVKNQLRNQAYQRTAPPLPPGSFIQPALAESLQYQLPADVKGGYNMAWGDYCGPGQAEAAKLKRDNTTDGYVWPACPMSTNSTTLATSVSSIASSSPSSALTSSSSTPTSSPSSTPTSSPSTTPTSSSSTTSSSSGFLPFECTQCAQWSIPP